MLNERVNVERGEALPSIWLAWMTHTSIWLENFDRAVAWNSGRRRDNPAVAYAGDLSACRAQRCRPDAERAHARRPDLPAGRMADHGPARGVRGRFVRGSWRYNDIFSWAGAGTSIVGVRLIWRRQQAGRPGPIRQPQPGCGLSAMARPHRRAAGARSQRAARACPTRARSGRARTGDGFPEQVLPTRQCSPCAWCGRLAHHLAAITAGILTRMQPGWLSPQQRSPKRATGWWTARSGPTA